MMEFDPEAKAHVGPSGRDLRTRPERGGLPLLHGSCREGRNTGAACVKRAPGCFKTIPDNS